MLAALLEQHRQKQIDRRLLVAGMPLPGTLSPFRLRFESAVRGRGPSQGGCTPPRARWGAVR
jgi:hypothetical protein